MIRNKNCYKKSDKYDFNYGERGKYVIIKTKPSQFKVYFQDCTGWAEPRSEFSNYSEAFGWAWNPTQHNFLPHPVPVFFQDDTTGASQRRTWMA